MFQSRDFFFLRLITRYDR